MSRGSGGAGPEGLPEAARALGSKRRGCQSEKGHRQHLAFLSFFPFKSSRKRDENQALSLAKRGQLAVLQLLQLHSPGCHGLTSESESN